MKMTMRAPDEVDLPFFSYGLFRPGQMGFLQLKEFVCKVSGPTYVSGILRLRDGLPILDQSERGKVEGRLLWFKNGLEGEAYERISKMEPQHQYFWRPLQVGGGLANVLVGKQPHKGGGSMAEAGFEEETPWDSWTDPMFKTALDLVQQTIDDDSEQEDDLIRMFRLQMAYMLLWSSIERYSSLRYHLGAQVMAKIDRIAEEPAFAAGLQQRVTERRSVYRADKPGDKSTLDAMNPSKSIEYYYQVRSNIAHRGKAGRMDLIRVKDCLVELLPIFRQMLQKAELESGASDSGKASVDSANVWQLR